MMPSPVYEEIGRHDRPGAYDLVRHLKCVVCGAPAEMQCVNPVTGVARKAPCIGRQAR